MKLYAFLWHVNVRVLEASEGSAGSYCESAETEQPTEEEAAKVLQAWLNKRQRLCTDEGCEHTLIITANLRPKMIMAGMTAHMAKV